MTNYWLSDEKAPEDFQPVTLESPHPQAEPVPTAMQVPQQLPPQEPLPMAAQSLAGPPTRQALPPLLEKRFQKWADATKGATGSDPRANDMTHDVRGWWLQGMGAPSQPIADAPPIDAFSLQPLAPPQPEVQPQIQPAAAIQPKFWLSDEKVPPDERDSHWGLTRGLVSGVVNQAPSEFAQALDGLGDATGSDWLHKKADQLREVAQAPVGYQPKTHAFGDVKDVGTLFTYLGERLGEGVASTAPSVAGGVAGATAGGAVAGPVGATVGGIAGAAAPAYVMNYGDLRSGLLDEGVDPKLASKYAAWGAIPISALDIAPVEGWVSRMTGTAARKAVTQSLVKEIAKEAAKGAGFEATTEALQQLIQEGIGAGVTGKDLWTPDRMQNVVESAVVGGLAGGVFGAGAGAFPQHGQPHPEQETPPQQPVNTPKSGMKALPPPALVTPPPGWTPPAPPPGPPAQLGGPSVPAGLLPSPSTTYGEGFTMGAPPVDTRTAVVNAIAGIENNTGNPAAVNPASGAMGDGQFIPSTWMAMIKQYRPDLAQGRDRDQILALRADTGLSREMIGHYVDENGARLEAAGLPVTPGTSYLAHFLGPAGAEKALKADPSTPLASVIPANAIEANPFLKGKDAGWVRSWADRKMGAAFVAPEPGSAQPVGVPQAPIPSAPPTPGISAPQIPGMGFPPDVGEAYPPLPGEQTPPVPGHQFPPDPGRPGAPSPTEPVPPPPAPSAPPLSSFAAAEEPRASAPLPPPPIPSPPTVAPAATVAEPAGVARMRENRTRLQAQQQEARSVQQQAKISTQIANIDRRLAQAQATREQAAAQAKPQAEAIPQPEPVAAPQVAPAPKETPVPPAGVAPKSDIVAEPEGKLPSTLSAPSVDDSESWWNGLTPEGRRQAVGAAGMTVKSGAALNPKGRRTALMDWQHIDQPTRDQLLTTSAPVTMPDTNPSPSLQVGPGSEAESAAPSPAAVVPPSADTRNGTLVDLESIHKGFTAAARDQGEPVLDLRGQTTDWVKVKPTGMQGAETGDIVLVHKGENTARLFRSEGRPSAWANARVQAWAIDHSGPVESDTEMGDRLRAGAPAVMPDGSTYTIKETKPGQFVYEKAEGKIRETRGPALPETWSKERAISEAMADHFAPETAPKEEKAGGVQESVPAGNARPRASDVQVASEERPVASAPRPDERPSERDVRPNHEPGAKVRERSGEEPSREGGGGGTGEVDVDRIPGGSRPDARAADSVKGENFVVEPDGASIGEGRSVKQKARDNLDIMELAHAIELAGRYATKEEQAKLVKFVGWGTVRNLFPDSSGHWKPEYEEMGKRLRDLLPKGEYRLAARANQYAHYTSEPVIRSMWDAVQRLGFTGGQVYEPGMGLGHFLGMMPADLAAQSRYSGLELDPTTARIAKLLYPQAGVRNADFTRVQLAQNAYDLIIGNPPFADIVIKSDPKYRANKFLLHDYFFAKSLDAVRPGGLMAFVTSAGTMNKINEAARQYLADRAELVSAIRLPSSAFAKNANTEVTTDILFFRKNDPSATPVGVPADQWVSTKQVTLPGPDGKPTTGAVNAYFSEHPDKVLGEQGFFDKIYEGRYAVRPRPGQDLVADMRAAIDSLPESVMTQATTPMDRAEEDFETPEKKEGSFYVKDGRLMQMRNNVGRAVNQRAKGTEGGIPKLDVERIKMLVPVRDALRGVYVAYLDPESHDEGKARQSLNAAYDAFVERFGPINKAHYQHRRPNRIQAEAARAEAREQARSDGRYFDEGSFDPGWMINAGSSLEAIAKARDEARKEAAVRGKPWDEGSFDPEDIPDTIVEKLPNVGPFMDDPESYRLRSIEVYNDTTGEAKKGDIFFTNILARSPEPDIRSPQDALMWSLNNHGRVDIEQMAAKAGKSPAEILDALHDDLFRVPGTIDQYETKEGYLSGDVGKKLALAKAAAAVNPEFQRNADALEAAMPTQLPPSMVSMRLGMTWIPPKTVEDFGRALDLGGRLKVSYNPTFALWTVEGGGKSAADTVTWGTSRVPAAELIKAALNKQDVKVYDSHTDENGRTVKSLNAEATQAAQDKLALVKERFGSWAKDDEARAQELADAYNEKFNTFVVRKYNGDYLTTPGISANWSWRPHQTAVVARIIQAGNTYMAHAVGAGKTSAMIGAGMEMRRLGLVKKPLYVVPNHMLGQFTREFYQQYPTARIAVADDRQFHTDRRKQFVANVAQNDLDAVIITHSAFGLIPISQEFEQSMIDDQLQQYRDAIGDVPPDDRISARRLQAAIENLEQRLRSHEGTAKDQTLTFEELGADFLFVDEAHEFRKLSFATRQTLKGIDPKGSGKAWDLYAKSRYLEQQRPGRSMVLASGTPITNTMAELYTLQRYLQEGELRARGISNFDAWASTFGDVATALEPNAGGGFDAVTRFSQFVNAPELSAMTRQVMDVVLPSDLDKYVVRPKLEGGARELVVVPRGDNLTDYQSTLAARITALKNRRGKPEPGMDILPVIINDGRQAALDMRFVGGDNDVPSKLDTMIGNVVRIWKDTKKQKFYEPGTDKVVDVGPASQLIFSNLGVNQKGDFWGYRHIVDSLVKRGIPRDQIAIIGAYKTVVAKQKLFNDVNEGKVRILIGSTGKMGTGMNVQKRLYASHNLDPLWYPADDEQRNGRILRQGNLNKQIKIIDYSTADTYDAAMWKMMARKAGFIEGFFRGDPSIRTMEDVGEASAYEQATAMSISDKRVMQLAELEKELQTMYRREDAHSTEQATIISRVRGARENIKYFTDLSARLQQAIEARKDTSGDKFSATVDGKKFTKRVEAGEAILRIMGDAEAAGEQQKEKTIGHIGGGEIRYAASRIGQSNSWFHRIEILMPGDIHMGAKADSASGVIGSLEHNLRSLEKRRETALDNVNTAKRAVEDLTPKIGAPFEGKARLTELSSQVAKLRKELAGDPEANPALSLTGQSESEAVAKERVSDHAKEILGDLKDEYGDDDKGIDLALAKAINSEKFTEAAPEADLPAWKMARDIFEAEKAAIGERALKYQTAAAGGRRPIMYSRIGDWNSDADRAKIIERLKEVVQQVYPGVNVEALNRVVTANGEEAAGRYDPAKHLIQVSLTWGDPETTLRHEAVHALKEMGLFKPEEWRLLEKWAKDSGALNEIAKTPGYADLSESDRIEEAIAQGFADWRKAPVKPLPAIRRVYARIRDFFTRMANALRGMGFDTPDSVFERIDTGEVGQRGPVRHDNGRFASPTDDRSRYSLFSMRAERSAHLADPAQSAGGEQLRADHDAIFGSTHKGFRERARDTIGEYRNRRFASLRQALIDQFHALKQIADEHGARPIAWQALHLTKNLTSVMASVLRDAPIEVYDDPALGKWFRRKSGWKQMNGFETIFKPLADKGTLDLWKMWKVARRADRLMEEGRENLISQEQIDRYKDAHIEHPEFLAVDKQWQAFNKHMLNMARDAGVITPEAVDAMLEHGDYVPFYRVLEEDVSGPGRGKLGVAGSGIRTLTGGESKLNDPIENMVMNMTSLVDRSFKNLAMQKAMRLAVASSAAERLPYSPTTSGVSAGAAATELRKLGVDVDRMSKNQREAILKLTTMQRPKDAHVSVMVDGKPQFYRIDDPLLLQSLQSIAPTQMAGIFKLFGLAKKTLTETVTADPSFMVANAVRDSLASFVMYGVNPIQSLKGAIAGLQESNPEKLAVMAAGGGLGGYYSTEPSDVNKFIERHATMVGKGRILNPLDPRDLFEMYKRIGQASESANRIARYRQVIDAGGSPAEAAYEAMDLLDFGMHGASQAMQTLIGMAPFMNARIQGLYKLGRRVAEDPKGFAIRGSVITAATLALLSSNWDNDQYEELEDWDKDTYWHFFVGGQHYKLPKPFEIGAIFGTIPERFIRAVGGKDDTKTSAAAALRTIGDNLSMNPTPQLVMPLIEEWANKDSFTGRPIEDAALQELPPAMRVKPQTSLLARGVGSALGVSPVRIDHLVQGYFGSLGAYALSAGDAIGYATGVAGDGERPTLRLSDQPVIRRFYEESPQRTTKYITQFYDMQSEVEQTMRGLKRMEADGDLASINEYATENSSSLSVYKSVEDTAHALSKLRQESIMVQSSKTLTGDQKRAQLDQITVMRNRIAQAMVQRAQATTAIIDRLTQ